MTKPSIIRQLEQEIAHLQDLRAKHVKNIQKLKQKIAEYGGPIDAPLHLDNQLEDQQKQLRQVQSQLKVLEAALEVLEPSPGTVRPPIRSPSPHRRRWLLRAIALAVLVIGVIIGGIIFPTIQKGGLALLPGLRATPTTEVLNARVVRTGSEVIIDGLLDEPAWLQGELLTYAVHPVQNDSTRARVRFLWDENYLYVGFDVDDTQVEMADPSTLWDGDSVSLILDIRGLVEHRQSLGESLIDDIALHLKPMTTLSDPADTDTGYTVEMRVKWIQPPSPGKRIPADLLSVDHDANPGTKYDAPGTVFSKLSWDGDGDVTSAGASLLLVDGEHSGGE